VADAVPSPRARLKVRTVALKALLFLVKEESLWRSEWKTDIPARHSRSHVAKHEVSKGPLS